MPVEKKQGRGPRRNVVAFWLWCAATVLVAGVLLYFAWTAGGKYQRQGARPIPGVAREDETVFATYGRSPSCKSCHEEAYRLWENSHHGLAERPIDPALDGEAFASHFKIRHGAQVSYVRTNKGALQIVTTGLDGKLQPFTPERVLAVSPLRQFLVPAPGGRYQATELAFDPNHPDWFDVYGEEDRRPGEWGHWTGRGMNWNFMCAGCHNTRVRKNYRPKTDSYETSMAERGVGCEACHGPMADHNAWQAANPNKPGDPTIRKLSREQMFTVCGSCHSRRSELTGDFRPGEKYFDHYSLSIPDETDLFYPDGQIRDEDFELTAFMGSRMHASGVRCIDCHEPHAGKVRIEGNNLCMVCHAAPAPPAPRIDPATHSHHKPGTRGDNCVDCHMPQTVYMQRHARHDHGFTIPDPLLTKQYGIPNACTRCHDNYDVDWAIEAVDKWYGQRMERPSRARAQIIARARRGEVGSAEALTGLLRTETNAFWRAVSAGLLRRWNTEPAAREALLSALVDEHSLVRTMAARAVEPLVPAGDTRLLSRLGALLNDPTRGVRIDAAWALHATVDTNSTAGRDLGTFMAHAADQPSGLLQLGVFCLDRGDITPAIEHLTRAISWDTNSAPLHHALAVALSMAGKSGEAVVSLQRACRLAPRDAEYRYKLGLALSEVGRSTEAREALERAVELDPRFARAWYNLGLARNAAGDAQGALDCLLQAEALEPRSAEFPYARATILARLGLVEEARAAATRALEIQPGYEAASALVRALQRN